MAWCDPTWYSSLSRWQDGKTNRGWQQWNLSPHRYAAVDSPLSSCGREHLKEMDVFIACKIFIFFNETLNGCRTYQPGTSTRCSWCLCTQGACWNSEIITLKCITKDSQLKKTGDVSSAVYKSVYCKLSFRKLSKKALGSPNIQVLRPWNQVTHHADTVYRKQLFLFKYETIPQPCTNPTALNTLLLKLMLLSCGWNLFISASALWHFMALGNMR